MVGGLRERLSQAGFLPRGKARVLIILVIIFVIVDGAIGWYTVNYSVADKAIDEIDLEQDIVDLQSSNLGLMAVRFSDSVQLIGDAPIDLQFSGLPVDIQVGDDSNALAVLTDDSVIHYFPPGQISEQWYLPMDGAFSLIGIVEFYSPIGHRPESIVVTTSNQSGDSVHVISIETQGIQWSYDFEEAIMGFDRSDNTGYFSIILEGGRIIHFAQFSSTPRMMYDFDSPVDEVEVSQSGTGVVALFDNGSKLSCFTTTSSDPVWTADLPQGSRNLQLRSRTTYSYLQAGEKVLVVENGIVATRIDVSGTITYAVPQVVDKIFLSLPGEMQGYKGVRAAPNWISPTSLDIGEIGTDVGGNVVIGWQGSTIVMIDDSLTPIGDDVLWTLLGYMVIGQFALLMIYGFWDKIVATRKEALYILIGGAIAGILVTYLFPDSEAIDWFGQGAFLVLAGAIAALSSLVSWRTEAGLASIVVGVVVGIILSIPLALVAHFIMESSGYIFPDSPFFSLAKLIYPGLKMGLVGGVVGYAAQRLIR